MKKKTIIGIMVVAFSAFVCLSVSHLKKDQKDSFIQENIEALTFRELWPNGCFLGVVEAGWGEPFAISVRKCVGCTYVWVTRAEYSGNC